MKTQISIKKWCEKIITGSGGFEDYEERELYGSLETPRERAIEIVEWTLRVLAKNKHDKETAFVLRSIVEYRLQNYKTISESFKEKFKSYEERFRMKIAELIDKFFPNKYCWADLVMWALKYKTFYEMFYETSSRGCMIDSKTDGLCYCGKFKNGELNKEQHEKEINLETENLPF